jgi:outer membrane biosynthesis protein TonB
MKSPAGRVVGLLPLLLLAGCFHFHKSNQNQVQTLAPPIEDAPPPKPAPSPTDLPPPVVTVPAQTPPPAPAPEPEEKPKPPVKHKKPASTPPPAANTTQQAAIPNPGVSAIGQLSSGEPSDLRQQTQNSITATERGLSGINRALSDQEKKTADHIREFLKQAKAALSTGDVDGAATLAAKAKVLLGELSK